MPATINDSGNGGACTRASKHSACSGEPGLNEIDDWRFKDPTQMSGRPQRFL